jgi:hypothetical protein
LKSQKIITYAKMDNIYYKKNILTLHQRQANKLQ